MQKCSQRERIMEHIQSTYGTGPEYLWADSPDTAVFRHPASRKWFAILMDVAPEPAGPSGGGNRLGDEHKKQPAYDRLPAVGEGVPPRVPHE